MNPVFPLQAVGELALRQFWELEICGFESRQPDYRGVNMINKDTSRIPVGSYCYTIKAVAPDGTISTDVCPYWSKRNDKPDQMNGHCSFLNRGDWDESIPGVGLLWDMVKECGINDHPIE